MLSGSSNSTPNQLEGDRQQFEGKLQSYYAVADTNASRLTSSVYALAAAIACEQQSVAATQAMLQFPANAAIPGAPPSNETAVIINGVANAGVAGNFGVPAAFSTRWPPPCRFRSPRPSALRGQRAISYPACSPT